MNALPHRSPHPWALVIVPSPPGLSRRPPRSPCHSDIHSIEYGDDTFFIRVTGGGVESKETLRFDVEKKTVHVANRAKGER